MISNKFGVLIHWVPDAINASPQSFLLTYYYGLGRRNPGHGRQ